MATYEELSLIREARSGNLAAQLDLGARYIAGSTGLPKNIEAALHWLSCAAMQDSLDACLLIARHIPLELALQYHPPLGLCHWLGHAFAAGETDAALPLAKLVLEHAELAEQAGLHTQAMLALQTAAHHGSHEAQWLWARTLFEQGDGEELALAWATRAALGGVDAARLALAEHAWEHDDHAGFLEWARPFADAAVDAAAADTLPPLSATQLSVLARCAQVLSQTQQAFEAVTGFWEIVAASGDRQAQFSLGLWLARIRDDGTPLPGKHRRDWAQAIQWLIEAGQQGMAEAWFALSKIYAGGDEAMANPELARHYRQKAAELGHRRAQYECGMHAWNASRSSATHALRAMYWLELASNQGCTDSQAMLRQIRHPDTALFCKTLAGIREGRNVLFTA